jgi:hypothetical protein
VDFEKAFGSLVGDDMWKVLEEYKVSGKIVSVIKSLCEGFRCRVVHEGKLTEPFEVITGVGQGSVPSLT